MNFGLPFGLPDEHSTAMHVYHVHLRFPVKKGRWRSNFNLTIYIYIYHWINQSHRWCKRKKQTCFNKDLVSPMFHWNNTYQHIFLIIKSGIQLFQWEKTSSLTWMSGLKFKSCQQSNLSWTTHTDPTNIFK